MKGKSGLIRWKCRGCSCRRHEPCLGGIICRRSSWWYFGYQVPSTRCLRQRGTLAPPSFKVPTPTLEVAGLRLNAEAPRAGAGKGMFGMA